jgi:CRISPR-associated protein Cas8a1/Csx13
MNHTSLQESLALESNESKTLAPLVLDLDAPGMTPMLRAGLGGLAASLLAISRSAKGSSWPNRISIDPGWACVEKRKITLHWGGREPKTSIQSLFAQSFQIREELIYLPGLFSPSRSWNISLGSVLQGALKLTFLQHGKSTQKGGTPRIVTMQPDDDVHVPVSLQPYSSFAHQNAWEDTLAAFKNGTKLAGWANPGAVGRHNAFSNTELVYSVEQTIATLFSIVGCLSFQITGDSSMGALVIPEPSSLIQFAEVRPSLTPRLVRDVYVAGTSDAVLSASLELKAHQTNDPAIESMHGVTLRATAWASQQKIRVSTMRLLNTKDEQFLRNLEAYERARQELPTRIIVREPPSKEGKGKGKGTSGKNSGGNEAPGFFASASALRGFIAENLAAGNPWFQGFATAKVGLKRPRYLHQFRQKDNLGALLPAEKKGLWIMIETTQDPEKILIYSVHTALRQRFGAIWDETKNLAAQTRKNRLNGERERWRLAFAKAKTPQQIRAALADLWSRAGSNRELKERWQELLPLLQPSQWTRARDLALVALASYREKAEEEEAGDDAEQLDDDSDS